MSKLTDEVKKSIDSMSYETMLSKWRFCSIGDKLFNGESGKYFAERMAKLRLELPEGEHTRTSKRIGWDR